jgi:hypothetical protein
VSQQVWVGLPFTALNKLAVCRYQHLLAHVSPTFGLEWVPSDGIEHIHAGAHVFQRQACAGHLFRGLLSRPVPCLGFSVLRIFHLTL